MKLKHTPLHALLGTATALAAIAAETYRGTVPLPTTLMSPADAMGHGHTTRDAGRLRHGKGEGAIGTTVGHGVTMIDDDDTAVDLGDKPIC